MHQLTSGAVCRVRYPTPGRNSESLCDSIVLLFTATVTHELTAPSAEPLLVA
jgi:hypothetical protein